MYMFVHLHFNPHTREGCDAGRAPDGRHRRAISIHTPVKGVTLPSGSRSPAPVYFNPHTREGCDHSPCQLPRVCIISIHTPVKGVTTSAARSRRDRNISIHTPVKGVTVGDQVYYTAPVGISIHTPVKGVTVNSPKADAATMIFQSTHP